MSAASTFAFRAMDVNGAASAGELEAESKAQVTEKLDGGRVAVEIVARSGGEAVLTQARAVVRL